MIQIPYDELGKMGFQQAVQKLANSTLKDPVAFRIKHVTRALREGFFAMREEYKRDIESKYALKDEKGAVQGSPDGSKASELGIPFACKEGTEGDAKDELDNFGKRVLKVNQKKISAEVLFKCNDWSARELEVLEPIVEEPTDV